mgnify:FL=1|jgi:hypothetical protein
MHYKREKKLQWTYYKYNSELYFFGSNNRKMREEEMLAFPLRKNKNILKGKNIFP